MALQTENTATAHVYNQNDMEELKGDEILIQGQDLMEDPGLIFRPICHLNENGAVKQF